MSFLISILFIFIVLVTNEIIYRKKKIHGEISRKFIHIVIGSFVAFWPFFLSWRDIQFLSISFLIVVLISKKINLFKSIHSVKRSTIGEIFFALSVGGISLIVQNKWIYLIALLEMSLADGLAAIIGYNLKIGKRYKVFGHQKSVSGTLTFFITSIILLSIYAKYTHGNIVSPIYLIYALIATFLENISVGGLDNLTIPFFIALVLKFF